MSENRSLEAALRAGFQAAYGRSPEVVTRAPGRVEFIGNHTDYNGGTVLGAAIDRSVWIGLARRSDRLRRFGSDRCEGIVEQPASHLRRLSGSQSWTNYPLGMLASLAEGGLKIPAGFDYYAVSDLPSGAGLSSSAAVELASGLAFLEAAGEKASREELVRAGRRAENTFVGVPCGILDQGVSGFGKKDHLVFIDCRGPRFAVVPAPADAHFWIFNTHTKHALVDGLYAERHRECMEAAKALGVALLADMSASAFAAASGNLSPILRKRARHVIEEIARVDSAVLALRAGDIAAVGQLLTASHRSSQTLFENSTAELDFLVDTLTTLPSVYGARLTGGGFGGAVMALTGTGFGDSQAALAADTYRNRFGSSPDILHTLTADGAEVRS